MPFFVPLRTGTWRRGGSSIFFRSIQPPRTARHITTSMAQPNADQVTAVPGECASTQAPASSKPLALPALPSTEHGIKMDMSSGNASVSLDHLGPIVVGTDGTMSRISNWDQMTEMEQKNTLRIISKRNQVRLEARRAEVKDGEAAPTPAQ
ncbi:hypothetical protein K3495_g9370 [Podosphaera aphanis]|nr:hypothetical protein K3495_g9370 [Podosphaera aphanis]